MSAIIVGFDSCFSRCCCSCNDGEDVNNDGFVSRGSEKILCCTLSPALALSTRYSDTYSNAKNDIIDTIAISICPLKTPATFSEAILFPSISASNPKKTSNPAVRDKKKVYLLLLSLFMNGNHKSPIMTGITPTYVPITANNDACLISGLGANAAASILL